MERHLDQFDLEAAAEAAAIRRGRQLGSGPIRKGARTMGAKMNYRKTAPALPHLRDKRRVA